MMFLVDFGIDGSLELKSSQRSNTDAFSAATIIFWDVILPFFSQYISTNTFYYCRDNAGSR